jgi:hypothetical protein
LAEHLLEHGHSFGSIENIMQVIKIQGKGTHLNTIEKFHIHKETINNNQLNEDHTENTNLILNTIVKFQSQFEDEPTQPQPSPLTILHPPPPPFLLKHSPHKAITNI